MTFYGRTGALKSAVVIHTLTKVFKKGHGAIMTCKDTKIVRVHFKLRKDKQTF